MDKPSTPRTGITWYIQCYKDFERLPDCVARLRKHCPDDRVMLVSDGYDDARFSRLSDKYGLEYHLGERLYTIENGGAILHRMLDLYFRNPGKYLVKIDPDTDIHRRIEQLPDWREPVVAGRLQGGKSRHQGCYAIHGGCIILTNAACQSFYLSNIFNDHRLKPPHSEWCVCNAGRKRIQQHGLISHEWTIAWACRQLDIPQLHIEEIYSVWKKHPSVLFAGPLYDVAVSHPRAKASEFSTLAVARALFSGLAHKYYRRSQLLQSVASRNFQE